MMLRPHSLITTVTNQLSLSVASAWLSYSTSTPPFFHPGTPGGVRRRSQAISQAGFSLLSFSKVTLSWEGMNSALALNLLT